MKSKKQNRIFVLFFLIGILQFSGFSQTCKTVNVRFDITGKSENFSKGISLILYINNEETIPLMFVNGFIVPNFKEVKVVDVCFIYNKKQYLFKKLPVSKFDTDWVFGIDKSGYFIRFNPKDGSDGTQVIINKK